MYATSSLVVMFKMYHLFGCTQDFTEHHKHHPFHTCIWKWRQKLTLHMENSMRFDAKRNLTTLEEVNLGSLNMQFLFTTVPATEDIAGNLHTESLLSQMTLSRQFQQCSCCLWEFLSQKTFYITLYGVPLYNSSNYRRLPMHF